ncbi:MAG: STN domain-containing protein [Planctomycetota bacterium]|nr:STN domain-containing protein [Planctomycetota bacterium]
MGLDGNDLDDWGLRFAPESGAAVRAGVALWLGEARDTIGAAERLRRIRAAQQRKTPANASGSAVRTWQARPSGTTRARAWSLAGLAALLALAALAFAFFRSPATTEPRRAERLPVAPAPSVAHKETPAPRLTEVAAVADASAKGLFVRVPGMPAGTWRPAEKGEAFAPGALVQLAANAAPAGLNLPGHESLTLAPGTLLRLGGDPAKPAVDVWRGGVEIRTYNRPLAVGTLAENQGLRRDLAVVAPSKHVRVEATRLNTPTLDLNGTALIDERALKPVACTVTEVVEGVLIQPGTANLLRVVDGGFTGVSVAEIAQGLQELLNVRVRLSPGAQKAAGEKAVTLNLGQVTGAEALSALAEQAGLVLQIRDGDVVLELPNEKPLPEAPPRDEQF